MATQRDTFERTRGSSSRVAPKKMNAPDSGLTIENSAPNASRKVVNSTPMAVTGRRRICAQACAWLRVALVLQWYVAGGAPGSSYQFRRARRECPSADQRENQSRHEGREYPERRTLRGCDGDSRGEPRQIGRDAHGRGADR